MIVNIDKAKNLNTHIFTKEKYRKIRIEWRRTKVIELRARGMTHGEIASELQVSRIAITSDIAYLSEQAKGTIKEHTTEHFAGTILVRLTFSYIFGICIYCICHREFSIVCGVEYQLVNNKIHVTKSLLRCTASQICRRKD